jgi:hypothetical protein
MNPPGRPSEDDGPSTAGLGAEGAGPAAAPPQASPPEPRKKTRIVNAGLAAFVVAVAGGVTVFAMTRDQLHSVESVDAGIHERIGNADEAAITDATELRAVAALVLDGAKTGLEDS